MNDTIKLQEFTALVGLFGILILASAFFQEAIYLQQFDLSINHSYVSRSTLFVASQGIIFISILALILRAAYKVIIWIGNKGIALFNNKNDTDKENENLESVQSGFTVFLFGGYYFIIYLELIQYAIHWSVLLLITFLTSIGSFDLIWLDKFIKNTQLRKIIVAGFIISFICAPLLVQIASYQTKNISEINRFVEIENQEYMVIYQNENRVIIQKVKEIFENEVIISTNETKILSPEDIDTFYRYDERVGDRLVID